MPDAPNDQSWVSAYFRGRWSNLAGGPVRELDEPAWKDAFRLVSRREAQKFHSAGRLEGIIAEKLSTPTCVLGNPQSNGVVRRESSIPHSIGRQVLKEADECAGFGGNN
jgi:hypothetical protein